MISDLSSAAAVPDWGNSHPHLWLNCCTSVYTLTCPEAMCYRVAPVRSWLSIPLPYSWRFALPPGQGPVE